MAYPRFLFAAILAAFTTQGNSEMHWTDPFNETHLKAPHYAEAGLKLIKVLRAEGWQPEDIEKLSSDLAVDIRNVCKRTLQAQRGT